MVLTNFECWAHGGSDNLSVNGLIERRGNSVDLFNPAVLQQSCNGVNTSNGADVHASVQEHVRNVSHLSSNGYYGFVACNVDDNSASQDDISKTTGGNNDVNKQHELYATSATIATTTGDDTMDTMDVEQHHMAVGAGSQGPGRECSGIEVDSMFLRREPALAATSLVLQQSNSNNGFGSDRRKRFLVRDERMHGMGAESGAVKRFRHGIGNREFHSVKDENATMYPSPMPGGKQFAMEQDEVAANANAENQMVLNFPDPNFIYQHHSYGQSQMPPMSGHVIDPPKSLNKRKQNSTHLLDIDQIHRNPLIENSDVENSCNMLPPPKKRVTFNQVDDSTFTYNQLQTNLCGDDTKNKFQHFVDTNLLNTTVNCSVDDQVHKYQKNDDDILESLFLSLHGGSNRHMWRHLSNCISDEI